MDIFNFFINFFLFVFSICEKQSNTLSKTVFFQWFLPNLKENFCGQNLVKTHLFAKHDKDVDILTYRDATVTSKFTKTKSPKHHTNFMLALDDSMECYLATK